MALEWNFKKKVGEAIIKQKDTTYTVNLYNGNAYLIFIYEYVDEKTGNNMYSLWTFWGDKVHAKNCLGITKGHDNIYEDEFDKIIKFRFNKTKCRNVNEIIGLIVKAFDNIDIEVYTEEDEGESEC